MTIEQAIARYLEACKAQGMHEATVGTIGQALRTIFEPVLAEHIAILTADQVSELRARLGRRSRQGGPILGRTRDLLWLTSHPFLAWCVQQKLLTKNPLLHRQAKHLGELVCRLPRRSGAIPQRSRPQTGLSLMTLRQFETARIHLSREHLLRLLLHPSMTSLPDKAKEAGLDLGLGNNGVGKHDLIRRCPGMHARGAAPSRWD